MTEEREECSNFLCIFPSTECRYAQTSPAFYVPWRAPEASTERPAIEPGRACPANETLYRHPTFAGKWQWQSLLVMGSPPDTQPGHYWTEPSPRAAYWRANYDTPQTARAQSARTDEARTDKSTH